MVSLTCFCLMHAGGQKCGPPPAPLNARVVASDDPSRRNEDADQQHGVATSATYICDVGYDLIG